MSQQSTLSTIIQIPIEVGLVQWAAMNNSTGWHNVLYAWAALNVIQGFALCAQSNDPEDEDTRPKWLLKTGNLCDLYMLGVLAFYGFWWSCAGAFIGAVGSAACRCRKIKT